MLRGRISFIPSYFLPILIEQEYRGGDHGNSIGTRVGNSIEKTPLKKAQRGEIGFAELVLHSRQSNPTLINKSLGHTRSMITVLSKHFNPANHLLGAELGPQVKIGSHPMDEKE